MKLKKEYERYQELYRNKFLFDPEEETFFHKVKKYTDPNGFESCLLDDFRPFPGFEHWKVERIDADGYLNERMAELEVSDKENTVELFGGVNIQDNERVPQKVFVANERGDIEILQYSLHRKAYTVGENRESYVYQTRLHPWHEAIMSGKYNFEHARNTPFWHKSLIEAYENLTPIDTFVCTEGQFKAFKASMDGIPTAGLTSIYHYRNGESKKIHHEFVEFILACQVKRFVILWDGDGRDISLKKLEAGEDISARPKDFFNCARSIRELLQEFFPAKKLEIYFASISTDKIDGNPKGIDDLLVRHKDKKEQIIQDFERIGQYPGQFIEWINITQESGIKKMREYFLLNSVQAFYQRHSAKIRTKSFVWNGNTYKIEKGQPVIEVPKNLKVYKRVGINYYKIIHSPVPTGKKGETVLEEVLEPWAITAIERDHGKDADKHIERFEAFTNIASHTDFNQVINNHWNLYYNINHNAKPGSWTHIGKLLKHLFQDHYDNEMILDYLTILYRYPMQKLPVICLVSREQSTGKSTFIYLLKLIFKQNMAIISNNDLTSDFNSHWTSKLIVASEETLLEKKDGYEKIKSLSTAKHIMRNEKNKTAKEIPCMVHFVFCSNHENDFIKIDDYDSRLWINKVSTIQENIKNFDQLIEDEIPYFVEFIHNREIKYEDIGQRLWFHPKDFRTAAFDNVVRHSEPGVIKDIREALEDNFLKWGGGERLLTVKNLKDWFGIKGDTNWLNKIIKQYFPIQRIKDANGDDQVTTYSFLIDEPSDPTCHRIIRDKGRPFIFPAHLFVKNVSNLPKQPEPEQPEPPKDNPKHDDPELPFLKQ